MRVSGLLLAGLVLLAQPAIARTLVVGQDAPTAAATVALARAGDVVEVPEGRWPGHVVVDLAITLRGTGGVLEGGGEGSVLVVNAAKAVVEDLRIEHSGDDLSGPDACIYVAKTADRAIIRRNTVERCAFGIWVHQVKHGAIVDNRVIGTLKGHRTTRGNGIQLFDSDHLKVTGNVITGGRDGIYVSATEHSTISANRMFETRYGIHYMFSYDNTISDNVVEDSGSGLALMGSLRLVVTGNRVERNADHGILLRDVQYTTVSDNIMRGNGQGLFIYSSTENTIMGNLIQRNQIGAKIWAGSKRNRVEGNRFVGNRQQVLYVSTQDLVWGVEHPGNFWSDYLGWDQDGDGIGDRPYTIDSFSSHLLQRYPQAVVLMRSPALELLTHLQARMPILEVATLRDLKPRLGGRE